MQIHNLPAQTTATDADVLAIDNGTTTQKITAANLGKKVTEDAKPAFTSNDSNTANAWTNVAVLASAETMKSILNKISTMFKNIRYLYNAVTDLNTKRVGTFTPNSELSVQANNVTVLQYGNMVALRGYVTFQNNISANTETVIGNISGASLPSSTNLFRSICGAGPAAYTVNAYGYLMVHSNGGVYVKLFDKEATTVLVNAVWFV